MSVLPRLGPTAVEMLESVHQHRLLSTRQLHELHSPTATRRWTQLIAADLQRHGLVAAARLPRGMKLLYVTPAGADAVETIGSRTETRRKVVGAEQASGPLQQHTLAVNDVGLCFVQAARERGDDCGPWAWRHEIAHTIGHQPGQRQAEHVIADALLTYQRTTPEQTSFHYRLIELDRATMPVDDLATKLGRYARLYRYTLRAEGLADPAPLWRERYSVFPTVLVVLANGTRRRLERRRDVVLALCGQDQELQDVPEVRIDVCLLGDLQNEGPFAPIIHSAAEPDRSVDWLGGGGQS
jgi:Replication-relaxation